MSTRRPDPPASPRAPAGEKTSPPSVSVARVIAARRTWELAARALAWGTLVAIVAVVMLPWLGDWTTFGFHDWDVQTAHRHLAVTSLLDHGEWPGWNPYACGGYPAWGYVEADTVVVSPWLPAYLALPIATALRVEVMGQALLGAVGAYVLAGRFTRAHAARALVAALWAVNGRWGLQTAAGHTWHLAYAWMPWCFAFYDRACEPGSRARELTLTAACLAMLVYAGGIYPLPHTVLLLGLYAALMAASDRSLRPLATLAKAGALSVALAAPKLLPMIDTFMKSPRLIESKETLDLGALIVMLTSRDQGFHARPVRVSPYGWHEWGIYIGAAGLAVLVVGFFLARGRKEGALRVIGALYVVLGFGAFHAMAPWTLLHAHVPMFSSQHVPSRFLYTAVLALSLVSAAALGRAIARRAVSHPWLDAACGLAVLAVGLDVALVAQKPMGDAMWMVAPAIPAGRPFQIQKNPPFQYKKRDWAGPMYLAMLGNTGVLDCYGAPPFERKGALATSDPRSRGQAFVDGEGTATLASFTPNTAALDVAGAGEGALAVYNMNYDEGWSATVTAGGSTTPVTPENRADVLAVRVPQGASRVALSYTPPLLYPGLALGALAVLALAALHRREARAARGEGLS